MSRHVIIELPDIGSDHARWADCDASGELVSELQQGTLAEAADATHGRKITLVVPGDEVLLAEATVPGGSQARAQQAVPYVLEEQLADDVDRLHFALGGRGKDDLYPVAVIGRHSMDTLTGQCVEAGIRPSAIVPETLALPQQDDAPGEAQWIGVLDDTQAVVRLNGHSGFSTDPTMAALMLDGARRALPEETQPSLVLYRTDAHYSMNTPDGLDVETRHCDSRLELYAKGLVTAPAINLMQGVYSPKTQFDKAWKPWRATAALLAVVAVLAVGLKVTDMLALSKQEAALDDAIAQVFSEAMPNARMQRPEAQMRVRLQQLGAGGTVGFTSRMSQLADSLATQPQTRIRSISYRDGRFDLDLTTDELPTLDALKQALSERGDLGMTVQSANREGDGLRGRVRVE